LEIRLNKQPQKYIAAVDKNTRNKLYRALANISELKGDIKKLKGYDNLFRFKINHIRILFEINKQEKIIVVTCINVRTNIKY
jgi:mRNA interferase RelE/StbE